MGMLVYSLLWVIQDLYHQPYCVGLGFRIRNLGVQMTFAHTATAGGADNSSYGGQLPRCCCWCCRWRCDVAFCNAVACSVATVDDLNPALPTVRDIP